MSVSFAGHELHSPRFGLEEARELARERFGVEGAASELGSHQDQNALIDGPSAASCSRSPTRPSARPSSTSRTAPWLHLGERLPLEVPLPCAALDGSEIVAVEREGVTYLVRLVTFVEGEPLIDALHLAPPVLCALGEVAGLVARALEDFEHPAADRADAVGPAPRRRRRRGARAARRGSAPPRARRARRGRRGRGDRALAPRLRSQIAHCDVTDWNVIGRRDARAG